MRTIETGIQAEILLFEELPALIRHLFMNALYVRKHAQAPYSGFHVGVGVVGSVRDRVRAGCNVERVSHSQCTHAEQNAIDTLVAAYGSDKVTALALVAAPKDITIELPPVRTGEPVTFFSDIPVPCGHCLQIIWENCYGDKSVPLYALARSGEIVKVTIGDALPFAFGPEALGIRYG